MSEAAGVPADGSIARASAADTAAALAEIVVPTLGMGVLIRRPIVMAAAERLDLVGRAVRRMQRLRATYGEGPLLLALPGRRQALLLSARDVHRVLAETDELFSAATFEKRAALAHFEPAVSLVSRGPDRSVRRKLNEDALDSGRTVHHFSDWFLDVVEEEAAPLIARGRFGWPEFTVAWHRMVRRVVLGDRARDDDRLTDMLARLRAAGNWAFLRPRRGRLFRAFHERLREHLAAPGPASLAAHLKAHLAARESAPADQVAHWLFAFEPAGMATIRALALLAAHPEQQARARRAAAGRGRAEVPFLRACILESLRLWPTTPAILREAMRDARWPSGVMPAGTHVVIYAPFFHRDETRAPYAHRFAPEVWLSGGPADGIALVPFSEGPGVCPGRHVVQMLGSAMLAALVGERELSLSPPGRLDGRRPMPSALDHETLRFDLDLPGSQIVIRLVPDDVAPEPVRAIS